MCVYVIGNNRCVDKEMLRTKIANFVLSVLKSRIVNTLKKLLKVKFL